MAGGPSTVQTGEGHQTRVSLLDNGSWLMKQPPIMRSGEACPEQSGSRGKAGEKRSRELGASTLTHSHPLRPSSGRLRSAMNVWSAVATESGERQQQQSPRPDMTYVHGYGLTIRAKDSIVSIFRLEHCTRVPESGDRGGTMRRNPRHSPLM